MGMIRWTLLRCVGGWDEGKVSLQCIDIRRIVAAGRLSDNKAHGNEA